MTVQVKKTNEEFIKSLKSKGINEKALTKIGANEANFFDYVGNLDANVKNVVADSFDKKEDYALQSKLAAGWAKNNFKSQQDVEKYCKANNIKVSVSYVNTKHITDNKFNGKDNKTHTTGGGIALYTFSDGKGGEIKVADANGNGGLETEELFMNEILSGITSDISVSQGVSDNVANPNSTKFDNSMLKKQNGDNDQLFGKKSEETSTNNVNKKENTNLKQEISVNKFEDLVKDLMESKGWSESTAKDQVLSAYSVKGLDEKQAQELTVKINIAA